MVDVKEVRWDMMALGVWSANSGRLVVVWDFRETGAGTDFGV